MDKVHLQEAIEIQSKKIERKDSAFNRYKSEMFVDIAEVDGKDEEGSSSDDLNL